MGSCCSCVKSRPTTASTTHQNPQNSAWQGHIVVQAPTSQYEAQVSNFNGTRIHTYNGSIDCDGPTLAVPSPGGDHQEDAENQQNVPLTQLREDNISYSTSGEQELIGSYEMVRYVSRGSFSIVYCVRCLQKNSLFALKQVRYCHLEHLDFVINEITCTKRLQHSPYIPGLEEVQQYEASNPENSFIAIVQEFIRGGTLREYCDQIAQPQILNIPKLRDITTQLQTALSHCHSSNIVHRDIKLDNILFENNVHQHNYDEDNDSDDDGVRSGDFFLFCDFGISAILPYSNRHRTNITNLPYVLPIEGTSIFRPPELLSQIQGSDLYAADVWSLGVCLAYVAFGKLPVTSFSNGMLVEQPSLREFPVPPEAASDAADFVLQIKDMQSLEPLRRPPIEKLQLLPFVENCDAPHLCEALQSVKSVRPAALRSPVARDTVTTLERWLNKVHMLYRYKGHSRYASPKSRACLESKQSLHASHQDHEDYHQQNPYQAVSRKSHLYPQIQ